MKNFLDELPVQACLGLRAHIVQTVLWLLTHYRTHRVQRVVWFLSQADVSIVYPLTVVTFSGSDDEKWKDLTAVEGKFQIAKMHLSADLSNQHKSATVDTFDGDKFREEK